jgi:hypothetical protein
LYTSKLEDLNLKIRNEQSAIFNRKKVDLWFKSTPLPSQFNTWLRHLSTSLFLNCIIVLCSLLSCISS